MDLLFIVVLSLATLIAVITDLKNGLIYNKLTFPLFFSGLIIKFYLNGFFGVFDAVAAGIFFSFITFIFSTPGGGDIKLAMAVGVWIGFQGSTYYLIGMAMTRVILAMAVKVKIYGIKDFLNYAKFEMITSTVPDLGDKNFKIFQNAAYKAGYEGQKPVVPGALWVAGGVLAYVSILSASIAGMF
jgi:hypothetical protein